MPELTAIDALELISARVRWTSRPGEFDAELDVIARHLAQISALEGRCEGMAEGAEYVRRELERVRAERDRFQAENAKLRSLLDKLDREIGDPQYPGSPRQREVQSLLREE